MTALYIILAVVAVIMLLLLIPADCILEFSYNNKENNGSVIIKYAFLKFKIFPNDKVEEEVENEEETMLDRLYRELKPLQDLNYVYGKYVKIFCIS